MKRLIINADDLGISAATNDAIREAHERGVLTSTSLLANGPAFEHAVEQVVRQCPDLGVGLHFNLTSGPACAAVDQLGRLVDTNGKFVNSFMGLVRFSLLDARFADWVRAEFERQWKVLADSRIKVSHVDGHQHIQMIPAIFRVVTESCRDRGVARIRVSHEPLRRIAAWGSMGCVLRRFKNLPKKLVLDGLGLLRKQRRTWLQTPDRVFGIIDSGHVGEDELEQIVKTLGRGVSEVITHPSRPEESTECCSMSQSDNVFLKSPNRLDEFKSLISPQVRQAVDGRGVQLVNYNNAFD